jgi:hypothetical protein
MGRVEFFGFTFLTRDISRLDRYSTEHDVQLQFSRTTDQR